MSTPSLPPIPDPASVTIAAAAAPSVPAAFIASCLSAARQVKQTYNVPIAVLIAQAALESGWGQHVKGYAYFGIKGHAPSGAATTFQTTEVIDGQVIHEAQTFRAYTSFADAADDYGRFLTTNHRYAGCFQHAHDPVTFITMLAAAGYATDPNYAPKLIALMQGHDLWHSMRSSFLPASASVPVVCCVLLLLSCSAGSRRTGDPAPAVSSEGSAPQPAHPAYKAGTATGASIEDQVLVSVSKALRQARLLSRPDRCYAYRFNPAADQPFYIVDIRENHSNPECGGDPQTQPHLFTVHMDKTSGALSQDAKSPGTFQPVTP